MFSFLYFKLFQALPVNAQIPSAPVKPPTQVDTLTTSGAGMLPNFVCLGLRWLFTFAILFAIVMILLAAYEYITSAGNPDKTKTATNRIIYAAIGIAVAILARTIPIMIGSILGGSDVTTGINGLC